MHSPRLTFAALWSLAVVALVVAPAASANGGAPKPYPFAPYVDVADYPPPTLADFRTGGGVQGISLGFVTADQGTATRPSFSA